MSHQVRIVHFVDLNPSTAPTSPPRHVPPPPPPGHRNASAGGRRPLDPRGNIPLPPPRRPPPPARGFRPHCRGKAGAADPLVGPLGSLFLTPGGGGFQTEGESNSLFSFRRRKSFGPTFSMTSLSPILSLPCPAFLNPHKKWQFSCNRMT